MTPNIILNSEELELLITKIVNRIFDERSQSLPNTEVGSSFKIDIKDTCKELNVSRPTLHNWSKSPKTKHLIDPHITKVGNRVWYDIEALKKTIKKYGYFFGQSE